MRWGRKNIILIIGTVCCAVSFACFNFARADYTVKVGATIDSKVSAQNSKVELSANETLADPENHPILMTIYLLDADGKIMPNITVECNSSRGSVDVIELFASDGTLLDTNSGSSDEDGIIRFRLSSYTPGNAIFSILVDTILPLPDQNIKFDALPFPGNIEVSVPLPPAGSGKKIIIIPNSSESQNGTPDSNSSTDDSSARENARKTANVGTVVYIPFWLFITAIFLMILIPLLTIWLFILAQKSKKQQSREMQLLEQIAQAEHIDQVKYYVDNDHR